jgi:hypothetical protein
LRLRVQIYHQKTVVAVLKRIETVINV